MTELAEALGLSERHVRRGFDELASEFALPIAGWRDFLGDLRLSWAQQLLSIPSLSMSRVASLSGFRSSVALAHAFSARRAATPGAMARMLRERWG